MNDQARGLVNGNKGIRGKQSAWMAHWTQASRNATVETRTCAVSGNAEPVSTGGGDRLMTRLNIPRSVEGLKVVEEKNFEVTNESARTSCRSLGNKGMQSSVFKHGQGKDNAPELRPLFDRGIEHGKAVHYESGMQFPYLDPGVAAAKRNSFGVGRFLDEGSSKNPHDWMRTTDPSSFKDIISTASKTLKESFVESSSNIEPYRLNFDNSEFNKGKTALSSVTNRFPILSRNQSKDIVCGRETGFLHHNSMNPCFRESNTPLVLDAPSTSDPHLPSLGQELFQEVEKYSGAGLFPGLCFESNTTKSKKSDFNDPSLSPTCNHDVEAMRICTMVDSVKGLGGGFPMFSQTTHSVVITKKTEVGLTKENEVLESTQVVHKINGNMSGGFHRFSPFFAQGNRGVRLQSLSSSTDSESKEGNVGNAEASKATIKNASSEETDTLGMDPLMEKNLFSGANASPSAKVDAMSSREVRCQWPNASRSDINLELPALPAAANLLENACPSSSRTQSLEMDMLPANVELPKRKSKLSLDDSVKTDSSDRWVKRLKLSSSNSSSQGVKNSTFSESTSHEKMNKFFSRILKNNITSSEATLMEHHGKEPIAADKSGNLPKEDQDFSVDHSKKGKELLLSHAWIQRWLCNESRITLKKPQAVVVCVPQSSKLALDEIHKKQFPSIGAMALMGKAMNGFQQCELRKMGSFTVWNTKAF